MAKTQFEMLVESASAFMDPRGRGYIKEDQENNPSYNDDDYKGPVTNPKDYNNSAILEVIDSAADFALLNDPYGSDDEISFVNAFVDVIKAQLELNIDHTVENNEDTVWSIINKLDDDNIKQGIWKQVLMPVLQSEDTKAKVQAILKSLA